MTVIQDCKDWKSPHLTHWPGVSHLFPSAPPWNSSQAPSELSVDTHCKISQINWQLTTLVSPFNSAQFYRDCWVFQSWVTSCHMEEVTLFFWFWEGSLAPSGSSLCKAVWTVWETGTAESQAGQLSAKSGAQNQLARFSPRNRNFRNLSLCFGGCLTDHSYV